MARDIYLRDDTDPRYRDAVLEISDPLSFLLSQIEMILFTNRTEVLGMPTFGVNLEELLFLFNVNEGQLSATVTTQIYSYCTLANQYGVTTNVNFIQGVERDIALIDILVSGEKKLSILL